MSGQNATADPTADPYTFLGFVRHSDGSLTRQSGGPRNITTPISAYSGSADLLVKDIQINPTNGTSLRLFLSRQIIESSSSTAAKLPLIIFFHGGGFISYHAASTIFEEYHRVLTTKIPAVFASVDYRLAPEHRLPAAYDDALEVLQWISNSREELLIKYADLSHTFLAGSSAGANISYYVGLSVASNSSIDLKPLNIKGLILIQPFFGGKSRTGSELRSMDDKRLPPILTDTMWELALPSGADRDHEYSNPFVGRKSDQLDQIKALGWKILVTGHYGDPLIDRQIGFVKLLEENNVEVVAKFHEGGYHGIEVQDASKLDVLAEDVIGFVITIAKA